MWYSKFRSLIFRNELTKLLCILLALLPFYYILYRIYVPHTNAFGCFDECMNYGGAYFMLHGKKLYSEIFFNHQPMMAYLSYMVQVSANPQNLYEFLLRHMQLTIVFSFLFNIKLIRRFGLPAVGFIFFYELSKFYIFGYRFLAESFIVYPLVYMTGLLWYKLQKQKIYNFEYILAGIFTWFVLFSREPYTFVVLFLYLFLIGIPSTTVKKISLVILGVLSLSMFGILPLQDYIFSVGKVSYQAVLQSEAKGYKFFGIGFFEMFFYPFFTFFGGKWNEFRILLIGISAVFIYLSYYFGFVRKQYFVLLIVLVALGLANIRVVPPGTIHYAAFHMIVWYGMTIFILFFMLFEYGKKYRNGQTFIIGFLLLIFSLYLFSPNNFIRTRIDSHEQLITNYGQTISVGEVVKNLSEPKDTFFIDYVDNLNLAYWQAQRISPYKYSWYTYVAPAFSEYRDARHKMFLSSPPDFYYGELESSVKNAKLSEEITEEYVRLLSDGKESKLYVRKDVYDRISDEKWEKAKEWGFGKTLPSIDNK